MAIPYATNPYPHQVPADLHPNRKFGVVGGVIVLVGAEIWEGHEFTELPRPLRWIAFSVEFQTLHSLDLDGPAIPNANRGDSCESICANRFAEETLLIFHSVRAIRTNRCKPAIHIVNFWPPEVRFAKRGLVRETLKRFARIRRFAQICESTRANRAI